MHRRFERVVNGKSLAVCRVSESEALEINRLLLLEEMKAVFRRLHSLVKDNRHSLDRSRINILRTIGGKSA
jgi:hypothetical protein